MCGRHSSCTTQVISDDAENLFKAFLANLFIEFWNFFGFVHYFWS